MKKNLTGLEIIQNFHKNAPKSAGVYRMLNENGDVLYGGKTKNRYNRIKNYTKLNGLAERIKRMIFETRKMEIIKTNTENEALIVEQDLIKQLNPKYNILLKDDKSYPYLTISKDEFPKLGKYRGDKNKSLHFFGPFPSVLALNESIKIIQSIFGLRTCKDTLFRNRQTPCLLYQIKRCSGPCCFKISKSEYNQQVDKAISFLKGENKFLIDSLSKKMQEASEARDYETAIIYRDKIAYLNQILKKSTFSNLDFDTDVICLVNRDDIYEIEVFFSRNSIICGNFSYFPSKTKDATQEEVLYAFIEQFYNEREIPKLILTNIELNKIKDDLQDTLSSLKGQNVIIETPQKGEKKKIIDTILQNAKNHLEHKFITEINQKKYMDDLQKLFELQSSPKRIDVFDNSHTFGTNKIGAMIVVGPKGFQKDNYRKYNIKSDISGDDYKMMEEVLTRRYTRAKAENTLPDLIIVDGGKGQLDIAHHIIRRLELSIPIVGIAKGENRNAGEETLYQFSKEPINLPKDDSTLFFLQRIRDEAHRFAITTHRNKRDKSTFKSTLDDIEGIGSIKKKALLNYFGSVKNIINANIEELLKVDGINKNLAEKIYNFFH